METRSVETRSVETRSNNPSEERSSDIAWFAYRGATSLGWFTVAQLGPNLGSNLGPNFDQVEMPSRRHCRELFLKVPT